MRTGRGVDSRVRRNDGIGGLPDFFSSLLVCAVLLVRELAGRTYSANAPYRPG